MNIKLLSTALFPLLVMLGCEQSMESIPAMSGGYQETVDGEIPDLSNTVWKKLDGYIIPPYDEDGDGYRESVTDETLYYYDDSGAVKVYCVIRFNDQGDSKWEIPNREKFLSVSGKPLLYRDGGKYSKHHGIIVQNLDDDISYIDIEGNKLKTSNGHGTEYIFEKDVEFSTTELDTAELISLEDLAEELFD